MQYIEAKAKLEEFMSDYNLDGEWDDLFSTALQAVDDCLEMGLTNEFHPCEQLVKEDELCGDMPT